MELGVVEECRSGHNLGKARGRMTWRICGIIRRLAHSGKERIHVAQDFVLTCHSEILITSYFVLLQQRKKSIG